MPDRDPKPTPAPTLRRARPGDRDAIDALERRNFSYDRLSKAQIGGHIRNPRAEFWVALDPPSGALTGYALVFLHRTQGARLYSIVTDKKFQGRGIGRALMDKAVAQARKHGARAMRLEVKAANRKAVALYKKYGFVITRRLPAYYSDGADGVKMLLDMA